MSEEKQARIVAAFGIRAALFAMVLVGMYCGVHTQREPLELLSVFGAALAGSVGVDYLVRVVTRYRPE